MYTKNYITTETHYSEQVAPGKSNWLRVGLFAFPDGEKELKLSLYTYANDKQEHHFIGTLDELIELVQLGKVAKTQQQVTV